MAPVMQYVFAEMRRISDHFTAGSHEWLPYSVIPTFPKLICKQQFAVPLMWEAGLYHLEDVEFQVVGFRDVPDDGVVGGLLAGFDLAQLHARIQGGGAEHFFELL